MTKGIVDVDIKYPGVSDRVKAAVVDSFIIVGFMFIASYSFSFFGNVGENIRIITFIFIFGLYDPIFTSAFGSTLGHMSMNLIIRKENNYEKKINLPQAIIRFIVKFLLGIISLFTVGNSKKHLAIHDLITGSVVLYKKTNANTMYMSCAKPVK